jgi:hypothetical protein
LDDDEYHYTVKCADNLIYQLNDFKKELKKMKRKKKNKTKNTHN